jgi:hypothetical protein
MKPSSIAVLALGTAGLVAALNCPSALAQDKKAGAAAGDTYVYRVTNKYSKETRGNVTFRLSKADASGATYSVEPAGGAGARTQAYDKAGNWLRYPIESHGKPVEYVFATPGPAYVLPLEPGKSWSQRVKANAADGDRARTVRVDGKVLRNERVKVPAGEFDTIVIRRTVYAGDASQAYTETRTNETEWYAPALGRAVRLERTSEWRDIGCRGGSMCDMQGDWDLVELTEARLAKR